MKMAIFYYVTSKINSFKKFRKIRELLKTFEVKLSQIGPNVSDAEGHEILFLGGGEKSSPQIYTLVVD